MPNVQVSYPGVYVQVVTTPQPPTGGTSTSIGAFVGRTPMGPINVATLTLNLADYTSKFGAMSLTSPISYQANGFFNNGGEQAVVVRLFSPPTGTISIGGTQVSGDQYTLTYTLDGAEQTPFVYTIPAGSPSVTTVAQGFAAALSTALTGVISATNDPPGSGQIVLQGEAATSFGYTSVAASGAETASWSGASMLSNGCAALPLYNGQVTVTVSVTASANGGDQCTLTFTPVPASSGRPSSVTYITQKGDNSLNVSIGLYYALAGNRVVNAGSTPPTSANPNLTLTYTSNVTVTGKVTPASGGSGSGTITAALGNSLFTLTAAALGAPNPGSWGNLLSASISVVSPTTYQSLYTQYNLSPSDPTQALFNLNVVYNAPTGPQTETFANVTLYGDANQPNRLDNVLANGSQYVGCTIPSTLPSITMAAFGAGSGGANSQGLDAMDYQGDPTLMTGLYALNQLPYGWNILSVPPDDDLVDPDTGGTMWDSDTSVYQLASQICVENNAMLIIDPPSTWYTALMGGNIAGISPSDLGSYTAPQARACAVYFPRIIISDPLRNGLPRTMCPSGYMAAAWAANDMAFGVWKAPAGLSSPIGGITQLQANLTNAQNGVLNPLGIDCLRYFTGVGNVIWGARTVQGSDQLADQYKYIPVQRLVDYIQTSLLTDTQWAVFQPNGPSLWTMLQTQINTFMASLFSQGAFAGTSASQAYFVKCDATTTSPANQAAGIVNVQVGFAPLYPAEFVIITISQISATSPS